MTGIVDWAASRARMVVFFIVLSLLAGGIAYVGLPKEGEPDIEIPALYVSVPFPGISAEDAEKLLAEPIEAELSGLDGLDKMSSTAAEGYVGVQLLFEFGWDRTKTLADARDRMNRAESRFPAGAENYQIHEANFSEFPIIIVNLTGDVPERTLLRVARDMQDRLESLDAILEAGLAGDRAEVLEVEIDPLRLEAYNVTADELIGIVVSNNRLIAAGEIETAQGAFSVKIPSSFDDQNDVRNLPIKVNGDRVVTLGDLADIRPTFEDLRGTARFNGEKTVSLQVVKRKGFNLIDTAEMVRAEIEAVRETWPPELRNAIGVATSNDQSYNVASMVDQLESSVLTAIALVMIVVLSALGIRSALLVGFAIPTSFMLCFAFLAVMGVAVSNIVMFGLILAVGMVVDGSIVVVEYAERRIGEGQGPMRAFVEAAKRMFWPIVSSTATTLCAFLPMLFWPGIPGEFMGMLPVTLIFVLSASLIVALIFLPVMGGVAGRISRTFERASAALRSAVPGRMHRAALTAPAAFLAFLGAMRMLDPAAAALPGALLFLLGAVAVSIVLDSLKAAPPPRPVAEAYRRKPFGRAIEFIARNPAMPIAAIGGVVAFTITVFALYNQFNRGVEFFVETEPEQVIVYVRARGNLSLAEKDALVKEVEQAILTIPGVDNAFAFAGHGGQGQGTGEGGGPVDAIGQIQIEMTRWEDRPRTPDGRWLGFFETLGIDPEYSGHAVMERLEEKLAEIPAIRTEILDLARGPSSGKPVHLRLTGSDWDDLLEATDIVRKRFENTDGLVDIEDTRPLPGIDWQIDVDVGKAGRYGADVATVGGMVQLVTRGIVLDTMRTPFSNEEIDIRVRLPESDRVLSTLDNLKVRTPDGLIPLSNFITRAPVAKLGQINRIEENRFFDVKAGVDPDLTTTVEGPDGAEREVPINAFERTGALTEWLETETPLPSGVEWEWSGDQEEQAESQTFLVTAFAGALGLMFIILLAQFNSFYNSVLVLLAVVLSTTGVLVGMLVMQQPFSIIMTGTGIVALAGIVVNNNIVLIDTYQEYARYMSRTEAIIRSAEVRLRPVLLTTITTMAGLTPMMFGLSLDFIGGGYSVNSPTALWWKQLATAVVFGLGIATMLTLVFTPSALALRVWIASYARYLAMALAKLSLPQTSRQLRDWSFRQAARETAVPEFVWDVEAERSPGRRRKDTAKSSPKGSETPLQILATRGPAE